jgi:hypothetical protein
MKKISFIIFALALTSNLLHAQSVELPVLDKSPMDISYFPANYPILKIENKISEPPAARVIYSRPQKAGRTIFGGLVKYKEVWRLGANEATEIEFFRNVKIGEKKVAKGRYTLYAIVNESTWTMILNKETNTWGAFKYDAAKDVMRIDVPVQKIDEPVESLAMVFEKTADGFNLIITWDLVRVNLPIKL